MPITTDWITPMKGSKLECENCHSMGTELLEIPIGPVVNEWHGIAICRSCTNELLIALQAALVEETLCQ